MSKRSVLSLSLNKLCFSKLTRSSGHLVFYYIAKYKLKKRIYSLLLNFIRCRRLKRFLNRYSPSKLPKRLLSKRPTFDIQDDWALTSLSYLYECAKIKRDKTLKVLMYTTNVLSSCVSRNFFQNLCNIRRLNLQNYCQKRL